MKKSCIQEITHLLKVCGYSPQNHCTLKLHSSNLLYYRTHIIIKLQKHYYMFSYLGAVGDYDIQIVHKFK